MSKDKEEINIKYKRPWGYYIITSVGKDYKTKILHVNKNQKLSVQSHNYRSEHWFVISNQAKVILNGVEYILNRGESIDIPQKAIHSLQNSFNDDVEIIEIQTGENLSEDDIIRYEDIYGRT